jgi:hypothetical protein
MRITPFLVAAFVTGCVWEVSGGRGNRYTPLNPSPHPLHVMHADDVPILDAPPQRSYVEVGTIDVWMGGYSSKTTLYRDLQMAAAQHGCEAVRIVGPSSASNNGGYVGACIVFTDSPAPASAAATTP